ncbi:hypothetical protein MCAP1_003420 [Malassezia caprae]|uniref:Uncharacterized protein n=1 Tax=Malassezia caprae TaxID=1381934 RepID=A0AAF0EAP9_9BASI|nr:hypothetical protein MCAP1_003420 [Malassezia caprae]
MTVLCGLDSLAGGTWLGVTRTGAFAVLTNITEHPRPKVDEHGQPLRSRGELVMAWMETHQDTRPMDAADILQDLYRTRQRYAGFNLLVGDVHGTEVHMGYVSNRVEATEPDILTATGQVYGLSNSTLHSPWPKIDHGKSLLQRVLSEPRTSTDDLVERLFGMMGYVTAAANGQ